MEKGQKRRLWAGAASITILCITLYFTFKRLFYGADFTDEAFYSAIPYEFFLGRRPFIDEINILQFPSFLLYPFFHLFLNLNGGTEGIILFNRILFFLFFASVSLAVFLILKRYIPWYGALPASLSCLAFIPNNIPALGYNTLGYGLLTLALFLVYGAATSEKRKTPLFFFGGLSFGFSVIAYPTMIIPFFLYCILLLIYLFKTRTAKRWLFFLLGSIAAAAPILIIMFSSGLENVLNFIGNLDYIGVQGGGSEKIGEELSEWYLHYPNKLLTVLLAVLLISVSLRKNSLYAFGLLFIPLLGYDFEAGSKIPPFQQSLNLINNYTVLALILFLLHIRDKEMRRLFLLVVLPSLFAGLTFLWSSSNGFLAAGLGFFPAVLALSFLIVYVVHSLTIQRPIKQALSIAAPAIMLVFFILLQNNSVYRDQPLDRLTAKVEFGPYKGLYTTKEKVSFMKTLDKDVETFAGDKKSIYIYSHIPGAYLFSSAKPAGNTIWVFYYSSDHSIYADYFKKHPKPEIVFRMKTLVRENFRPIRYHLDDELNLLVKEKYSITHSNKYYDILVKRQNLK